MSKPIPPPTPAHPLAHLMPTGEGQSEELRKREADRRRGKGRRTWFLEPRKSPTTDEAKPDGGESPAKRS